MKLEFIDLLFNLGRACLHLIIAIFHANDSLVHGDEQFINYISDFIFKPKPFNLIGFSKGLKFCRQRGYDGINSLCWLLSYNSSLSF
jgi:hypothetical protein